MLGEDYWGREDMKWGPVKWSSHWGRTRNVDIGEGRRADN